MRCDLWKWLGGMTLGGWLLSTAFISYPCADDKAPQPSKDTLGVRAQPLSPEGIVRQDSVGSRLPLKVDRDRARGGQSS